MTITNTLPVSNVINVSVTDTPSGLTTKNVNSLAIFTQDAPINGEQYGIYISPSQVAANYGTNSTTYQMANNIFAQVPNVLTGAGRLVIIPMLSAVSATHGTFSTANISANLAGIIAATNGTLNVTVDGVDQSLVGLNFNNCVTFADIAAVFNLYLTDAIASAISTTGIEFTSKKVGTSSTVALTAGTGGTDLNGTAYLHGATGTADAGANSSGETIAQCLTRTQNLVGYVPIMSTLELEDAAISAAAAVIQASDNMFLQHCASTQDIAGIATTIASAGQTKTRILLYTRSLFQASLMKAAYAGRAFSVDFTGSNTSQTMNLKQLANVTPDNGISETLYVAAQTAGCDLYVSYDGVPSVVSNGGNDFFDNPYSDLAAKFYLQTAGFNYLRQTNTKVPQTEAGMDGLKNAYRQVCNQFVTNGCWAPGSWTSSEFFGNPVIFTNNVLANGFYIFSQPVAQQNSDQREQRIAPLVQIAAKRAGAIHSGDVIVVVNA